MFATEKKKKIAPPIRIFSLHGNGDTNSIGQEIPCLPCAGFFFVEPFPNYNTVFLCIKMLDVYYKCKDLAREILCLPNIWEYI